METLSKEELEKYSSLIRLIQDIFGTRNIEVSYMDGCIIIKEFKAKK